MFAVTIQGRPLDHPAELYIDGSWVSPSADERIVVVAPATEQPFLEVASANEQDIHRAISAARDAFDEGPWPQMSPAQRAEYLTEIARELDRRAEDVAAIWPNEMGILYSTALAYAKGIGGIYDYYAALAADYPFLEMRHSVLAPAAYLAREPVGVVGAIVPWNGPISLIAYKLAPALLAGCTAVLKASPEAPGHALLMAEIFDKVGLPRGVVNVLTADRGPSETLVRDARVDKIAFTGSTTAGRAIGSICGERLAHQTLELGGKSAGIICDDYDTELAAETIAARACNLTGQVCASLTRLIIDRERHDDFVDALSSRIRRLKVGDPFDAASDMGPLATERQRERVEGFIASGRKDGFQLAAGGGRPKHLDRGWYIEPTVFAGVDNSAKIAQEEIFGPVLCVIPTASEAEAVALANDSPYGLAGSVFTNDPERALRIMQSVRAGTMSQNGLKLDFSIGFGGYKLSGIGREGGIQGLESYLETKTLLLETQPHERPA